MSDGRDVLPPDVKALVDAERDRFAIPDEARDRLFAKLVAGAPALGHGGHGAGPSAPPAGPVASASSTLLGSAAVKLIVALSVVGAATVLVQARSASRSPAVPVAASSPPPPAVVATADPPVPAPPLVPEAPPPLPASSELASPHPVTRPAREAPHPSSAPASAPPPEETREESANLAEERRLLDAARASIVAGSPEAAVPMLESCAARFPGGPLTEERLALHIRALARTGRGDEARALLATLRADYPHSFVLQGAIDDVARIP